MKRVIVCKCVGTHETWYASPIVCTCKHFGWPPPLFLHLCTYFMDGLFFNQKSNNNIRIWYSLKYKHSKKEYLLYEKIKSKNKSIVQCQLFCVRANFAKKSSCLVLRILSYDTADLHLLTFHILEPFPSKDIALGLSHTISH